MRPDDTEVRKLRRLLRDLVALSTTPASWVGREPPQIADGVADILLHTLRADAVYVCLHGTAATEGVRAAAHLGFKAEIQRLRAESSDHQRFFRTVTQPNWPSQLNVAIQPIGLSAEVGFVAVGCSRPDFPDEPETLLLSVAANQAAVAMQSARLRMRAEVERHRIEELLAQAPAAIAMLTGPEHRWTYVNENFVRVTGRSSAADFLGKRLREGLPEVEIGPFADLIEQVYRSGQPYVGREMKAWLNRGHTHQPEEGYFDFVYQPVRTAEGAISGILIHAVEVTEKVLAHKKIEESESSLRAIIETTPECVKLVASDGTLLQMNPAGLEMVGADCLEGVVGKSVYDLIAPQDRERFRQFNERVCRGERGSLEFDIVGLKGVRRHMETHSAPLRNPDGAMVQLAVTRDVTDRRRSEQALQQSEKKYREFAETATIALHWVGPDGIILWANQAELDMLGYSAEEYIGRHIAEFHVDAPIIDDILTRLCRGEKLREYEARLRAKDGSIRNVLIDSSVLFEDGKFIHTRCFTRDITQHKLAEQALRESEQRLRVVTDASPVMIWMSGKDKLCYYFNKVWLEFVGRTLEQEMGSGRAENVHPDDFDRCLQIYVTSFDKQQPFEMEYRLRHHSGQYRWILDHGVPRYAPDGSFEGYVGGCLDIQDQKEAAEKLRHAAEELRESEERYRTVAETASDAIVSVDESGTILFTNSATRQVFGYASKELIGKNLSMLMPGHQRPEAGTGQRNSYGKPTELAGLHKDGREIPLEVAFGEYTKAGKRYSTLFARDIAERKRSEERLRQSEMEFRGLANSMPTLVWMANPDGWVFWYNQRWYEYTGTTPEQMEGWGWQSVHDPATLPKVLERWKQSISTGAPFEMTFPVRGADGSFRPFLTRVTPVRDHRGNVTRWFGTNTDVSVEVQIQEKLQTALFASQKLAAIVESSNDAIVSKDLRGVVTSWNRAAEQLFGYSAQEMIGRPITVIIPPELQNDEEMILQTIGRGKRIEHYETIRQTKSGERIQVSVTISPIRDEAGNVIGGAKIARDVTQQKNTEQALRTTERLAAVGRLAATVAHEINNPLAAVMNLIYLSKQSAGNDVKKLLASAEEELVRIAHLTKQTLGFYRESKEPTKITLASVVDSAISIFTPRMRNKGITVDREIKQDPEIYAVPGELRQLVGNLLSNSIDAVDSGGRIQIRVSLATTDGLFTRGVRLTIADSGTGIPEQLRARVFEPFFTTKKDVGTGLGLWICKGIVDRYCGLIRIWSRTTAGRSGTIVSVVLPLTPQEQALTDALKQAV